MFRPGQIMLLKFPEYKDIKATYHNIELHKEIFPGCLKLITSNKVRLNVSTQNNHFFHQSNIEPLDISRYKKDIWALTICRALGLNGFVGSFNTLANRRLSFIKLLAKRTIWEYNG